MVNGPESNEWVPIGGQPLGLRLLVSVASQAGTTLLARTTCSGTGPPDRRTLDKTRMQVGGLRTMAARRPLQSSWLAANVPRHRSAHLLTAP
jgi:hypothetical protein